MNGRRADAEGGGEGRASRHTDWRVGIMETDFTRLPRYARIGLAAILVASLPLGLRLSWLEPRMRELDAKRAALAGREAELMEARGERARLARARDGVDELDSRLDRLGAVGPGQDDVSALLRRLEVFALESDLTIRALRPRPPSPEGPPTAWSYRLQLDGTYEGLTRFFRRVGGLSRIVAIDDVAIRAADPPGPGRTIAAECTASAFVLRGASPPDLPGGEEAR